MSSQTFEKQLAKMSDRAKERVRRLCRTMTSDSEIAMHLDLPVRLVALIRATMPCNEKGGGTRRGTPDRTPPHQRTPKHLSEDPIALDTRYTADAVVGSRRLLVRMLETGKHWLPAERYYPMVDRLKAGAADLGGPTLELRRRINSL